VPVQTLLDHVRAGRDLQDYLDVHPDLPPALVREVLVLALAELIRREQLPPAPSQASLLPRTDERGVITNPSELRADLVVGRRVLCPACRTLVFRAWPEGWDAHAEHKCAGITAVEGRARKAEFKRRYGHLFR
jgi:hypothetical protein